MKRRNRRGPEVETILADTPDTQTASSGPPPAKIQRQTRSMARGTARLDPEPLGSSQATAHVHIQTFEPSNAGNLADGAGQALSSDDDSDDEEHPQLLAAIADSLMADIDPLADVEPSDSSDSEDDAAQQSPATPPDDSFETLGNGNHLPSDSENEDTNSSAELANFIQRKLTSGTDLSLSDKMDIFARLLRHFRMTFGALTTSWLGFRDGARNKRRARKAANLAAALADDLDFRRALIARSDGAVIDDVVGVVRNELALLQKKCRYFGKFDPKSLDEKLNLRSISSAIEEHAPMLVRLIRGFTRPVRGDINCSKWRPGQQGRLVLITSLLQLGRARNSANAFARLLGLYFMGMGVKRRVLSVLHGLGIIDSYTKLNEQRLGLVRLAKVAVPVFDSLISEQTTTSTDDPGLTSASRNIFDGSSAQPA